MACIRPCRVGRSGKCPGDRSGKAFVRSVEAANYEIEVEGKKVQPLLVDVEHLEGQPLLSVRLDGKEILSTRLDTARYCLEAPMPSVTEGVTSVFEVRADGKVIQKARCSASINRFSLWRNMSIQGLEQLIPAG